MSVKQVSTMKKVLISMCTTTKAPNRFPVILDVIKNDQNILEKRPLLLSFAHYDRYFPYATQSNEAPNPHRAEAKSYTTIMK